MSFRNVQSNNAPARTLSNVVQRPVWERNPAWPALTTPTTSEQKVVGLYAIWPGDSAGGSNFFAVNCSGAYTVDFGDGTSVNTATGTQTNYEYSFNNANLYDATVTLSDAGDLVQRTAHGYKNEMRVSFYRIVSTTGLTTGQLYYVINATDNDFQVATTEGGAAVALTTNGSASLLPYKVATVTITPQAGQNLTSVDFLRRPPTPANLSQYCTGWLDLAIAGSNITSLTIGSSFFTVVHRTLERVTIVQLGNATSFFGLFENCRKLKTVTINAPATVTSTSNMFTQCHSLIEVGLFDTTNVTSTAGMFSDCSALTFVPLFNTANVIFMDSMFTNCTSLTTVPLFNTAACTRTLSMFSGCRQLKEIPPFNTANVTNMNSMFANCSSIETIPLLNTSKVTFMNSMFTGAEALVTVPQLNTGLVTIMSQMFSNCLSLSSIPLFNTISVTSMAQMFQSCRTLTAIPLFNTVNVTNMSSMLSGCSSLTTVPLLSTSAATNMSQMFTLCSSLTEIPAMVIGASSSANLSNIFSNCPSLARIRATNLRFTFAVSFCKLSATALNEIYTNLPTVTGQTIDVSSNYGTASDNPAIATAKGWSVTG